MSNIYNLEPPTKGKVCLTTTLGDIEVELWPKEAPLACRNFVQLCLEGFYLKTTFHRIIPKFMIQAGDETGTGKGGVSIYGQYFKDEVHSRLRFTHRGLVACANQNESDTNNSQFFITLDRCEDLDKRYTIFAKVAGDTIFNVLRIAEIPTDSRNHPLDTVAITGCDVLWNPFDDIVPRTTPNIEPTRKPEITQTRKKKETRNMSLLSFAEDEEIDDEETGGSRKKMKSAHDVLHDEQLILEDEDTRIRREEREEKARREKVINVRKALAAAADTEQPQPTKPSLEERLKEKVIQSQKAETKEQPPKETPKQTDPEVVREPMGYDRLYVKKKKATIVAEDTSLMDEAERTRSRLKQRKKLYGDREKSTLQRLAQFQSSLRSKREKPTTKETEIASQQSVNVDLPAAWRVGDYLKDCEMIGVTELLSHRLEFDHAKKDSMSRDMHALDDYIVVDTRFEKTDEEPLEKWTGKPNV